MHAQLGSSNENSELAGAFASWVGDQGPSTTLLDTFKRQSDLPLVHEQDTAPATELLQPLIDVYRKFKERRQKPVPELEELDLSKNTVRGGRMQLEFSTAAKGDMSVCKVDNWFSGDAGVATGGALDSDSEASNSDSDSDSDSADFSKLALDQLFGSAKVDPGGDEEASTKSPTHADVKSADAAMATGTCAQLDPRHVSADSHPDSPRDALPKSRLSRPLFTPKPATPTDHEPPVIEGVQQFEIDPDFDYDNCPCSARFGSERIGVLNDVTS